MVQEQYRNDLIDKKKNESWIRACSLDIQANDIRYRLNWSHASETHGRRTKRSTLILLLEKD